MRLAPMLFAAGITLSSSAHAQTTDSMPTDVPPASNSNADTYRGDRYSFTGLRAEVLGGYSRQLPDVRTNGPVTTTSQVQRHSGGSAGLQGGYDVEVGPVVVGVFGGYALLTSQGCGSLTGQNQGCLRPQAEAEGGARVGFQVRSRVLAYAKGSYVNTRINTTVRDGVSSFANSHINKDGWRVGGGVEFALLPHLYLKAEYDYTRTERFDAAPFGFQNTSISYHDHAALAGVGVRF